MCVLFMFFFLWPGVVTPGVTSYFLFFSCKRLWDRTVFYSLLHSKLYSILIVLLLCHFFNLTFCITFMACFIFLGSAVITPGVYFLFRKTSYAINVKIYIKKKNNVHINNNKWLPMLSVCLKSQQQICYPICNAL